MKFLFFGLTFISFSAMAGDICSGLYDGTFRLHSSNEYNRVGKIERIEKLTSGIRKLKANSKLIEIDRYHLERIQRFDTHIFDADIGAAFEQWKPFFRKFEQNFHEVERYKKILAEVSAHQTPGEALESLVRTYKEDNLMLELLQKLNSKNFHTSEQLVLTIASGINQRGRYLGNHVRKYSLITEHLDELKISKYCDSNCKKKITELKSKLSLSSKDELSLFPHFQGLKSPSLKQINETINRIPKAYEMSLMRKLLHEVRAAWHDLASLSRGRQAIGKMIIKLIPQKNLTQNLVKTIDKLMLEVESVANHYPIISKINRNVEDSIRKLDYLRIRNTEFSGDELLVTFARRVDQQTKDSWSLIKSTAQKSDETFYKRMIEAEKMSKIKGELSPNYKKSPLRTIAIITGGVIATGGTMMLLFKTDNEETEIDSSGGQDVEGNVVHESDQSEVIELEVTQEDLDGINTDVLKMTLPNEESVDFMLDYSEALLNNWQEIQ